jgi:hypothetical protein
MTKIQPKTGPSANGSAWLRTSARSETQGSSMQVNEEKFGTTRMSAKQSG